MTDNAKMEKIITIPNVLTVIRILLIIPFVIFFLKKRFSLAFLMIAVSAVTDMADGYIARKYDMISNLGKMLDPIADKLTQIAVFGCLSMYRRILGVIVLMVVVFEATKAMLHLIVKKRTGYTTPAAWHGKVVTAMLYTVALIQVIFPDISQTATLVMMLICAAMMTYSFIMYLTSAIATIRANKV